MTIQIDLPAALEDFVETQAAAGGFESPSQYVLALLCEVQKRQAWDRIEPLILEGLESGAPIEVTSEWWEAKRRRLEERNPDKRNA